MGREFESLLRHRRPRPSGRTRPSGRPAMIVMPTIPLRNKNAGMVYQHVHFRDGGATRSPLRPEKTLEQAGGGGGYGAAAGSVVRVQSAVQLGAEAPRRRRELLSVEQAHPRNRMPCPPPAVRPGTGPTGSAPRAALAAVFNQGFARNRDNGLRNTSASAPPPAFRPAVCSNAGAAPTPCAPRPCLPAPVQAGASNRHHCPWPTPPRPTRTGSSPIADCRI